MRPVWAEINLKNVAWNIQELKKLTGPQTRFMAVVKANGYGHGASEVAQAAMANGADSLGVATLEEALKLRQDGFAAPILVLGYTPEEGACELVEFGITQTVFSLDQAAALSRTAIRLGRKAKIQIKIDTGMGRVGFLPNQKSVEIIGAIAKLPHLSLQGFYTHFACADLPDKSHALGQLRRFQWFLALLEQKGIAVPLRHAANTAALMDLPQAHLDLVRAGIGIYGLYPSPAQSARAFLKPALSLKARVVQVKTVPAGTTISYGATFRAGRESVIATLPLGYADGISRNLSNRGQVLLNGCRAPIVGRICMDQLMVDATLAGPVREGDEAVLIGRQGLEEITATEIAGLLGTINYEITCMISSRVRREYLY